MTGALLPETLRADFPLLAREHCPGRPFVYLDSAATALKPRAVIEAVVAVLSRHTANVHRAVHMLGDEATELFEAARATVARFIGAEPHEVVFVRNATEGLNLVARACPRRGRVLVSRSEHHSNLLPWSADREATLIAPRPDGTVDVDAFMRELARGDVAVVAVAPASNVTGGHVDVCRLAGAAHVAGAILVVDGAQSVAHAPTDVGVLDCDFLVFSGHKLGGPTGIGVLYGKADRLAEMSWHLRGGGTVEDLADGVLGPRQPPWRFEAGTPAIEAAVGLGAALDFLSAVGMDNVQAHLHALHRYAVARLRDVRNVRRVGPAVLAADDCGPLSLVVADSPAHMLARALSDGYGVCVRSGYHCAQPLHQHLALPPTLRVSYWIYNQPWELDVFFNAVADILAQGRVRR